MADRYLLESGAPDGYLLEDSSGVLLLEGGGVGPLESNASRLFRKRRNSTNRRRLELKLAPKTPLVASSSRQINQPFVTRNISSRKHRYAGWLAALAPAPAAPAVPIGAWLAPRTIRREATKRKLVVLEKLHWPYIAPTIGAVLQPPKARYIKYERRLRQNRFADLYPQITPTGPPPDAWKLAAVRVVSQRRRLLKPLEPPVYPATPQAPSPDRTLDSAFITRQIKSRKFVKTLELNTYPTTPSVTPAVYASLVQNKARRTDQKRRLLTLTQPSYPPTPEAPPSVPFAAVQIKERKRRKARQGLFLGGGCGSELAQPPVTAALYPSFVQTGYRHRRDTKRKLIRALVAPVFTATPPPTVSPDRSLQEPFVTRQIKSRRLITAPPVLNVAAAPPQVTPAVYASLFRPKTHRRKARQGLFLTDLGGIVQPAQPLAAWAEPKKHRTRFKRRLRREQVQPVFPATPPIPPQPEPSFRKPRQFFKAQARKRIDAQPQITYPPTQNVMRVWIGTGTVTGTGTRVFIKG